MTNIEKHPNTRDALDAWGDYQACGGVYPFEFWAHVECSDSRRNPLLAAAAAVVDAWRPMGGGMNPGDLERCLKRLYRVVAGMRKTPTEGTSHDNECPNANGLEDVRPERTGEDAETMPSRLNRMPFSGEPTPA